MQDHPKGPGNDPGFITPAEEEARDQAQVLHEVLWLHPVSLTQDELIRELTGGAREFSAVDAVQRAVRDLAGSGLLHRPGEDEMVRPTRAAIRFSELTEGAA